MFSNREYWHASYEQRLMAKVRKTRSCWLWQDGSSNGRYGRISYRGRQQPTHVVAYKLFVGDVPKGLHVLHTCDNGFCVNPKHLWLGTHKQNMEDKVAKGRSRHTEASKQKIKEANARRFGCKF